MIQQFSFCVVIQKNWKQDLQKRPVHQVHGNAIHNGQKAEAIQCPSGDARVKNTWHAHDYHDIFIQPLNREEIMTRATTWWTQRPYAKRNKLVPKGQTTRLTWGAWSSPIHRQRTERGLPGAEGRGGCRADVYWTEFQMQKRKSSGDGTVVGTVRQWQWTSYPSCTLKLLKW